MTVLIGRPRGSVQRIRSSGLFYTTILRSDWAVLVVPSSVLRRDFLSTYLAMERPILTLDPIRDDEHLLNPVE